MRRKLAAVAFGLVGLLLVGGVALAAEGSGGGLGAGPIIGIVISCSLAVLLIGGSLGYILPKPPKR
jgi:hypothetical protein